MSVIGSGQIICNHCLVISSSVGASEVFMDVSYKLTFSCLVTVASSCD